MCIKNSIVNLHKYSSISTPLNIIHQSIFLDNQISTLTNKIVLNTLL